ncbi:MAG TPA: hypothetical protein VFA41_24475 [Ktedonobacteraceae bacterium]|nr:hypothetical protein [Ktedonobacteraceae bacterium]
MRLTQAETTRCACAGWKAGRVVWNAFLFIVQSEKEAMPLWVTIARWNLLCRWRRPSCPGILARRPASGSGCTLPTGSPSRTTPAICWDWHARGW